MVNSEEVVKALKEAGRAGLTAEDLAKSVGSQAKDLAHAGRNFVYEARQEDPTLETKIDKQWIPHDEEYRYYLVGIDSERLYDSIAETSDTLKQGLKPREGVDVILENDEPVLLVIVSDLHLGHKYACYKQIKQAFKTINKYDNVYLIGLGDLIDNSFNTHAPQGSQNLIDKNEQISLVEHLFSLVHKSKILRLYEGNHEIRSWISDHFLPTKWLAMNYSKSYGYFSDPFIIEIGQKKWEFFMRHKAGGSSQYNNVHNCVRAPLFEGAEFARNADIIVTAHAHRPGQGRWKVGGKKRHMLACASMVDYDDYAERIGYVSGKDLGLPAIYLREDREPLIYDDYMQAIQDWIQ